MSKKKNRKPWWVGNDYDDDLNEGGLFSNSINQHNKKIDKDIYIYEDEDDAIASPYAFEWGLDRKLNDGQKSGEKKSYEIARDEFKGSYGGTHNWKGYEYYKTQQLSYKYVQQMANMLASQYKITVQVGNTWEVDLKKKTLIYNPASLIYGTKSELLATLMHEIGKLRYGTHPDEIKEKYLATYGVPAVEVLSIFEDIRVDYWMLKEYEGAGEIYESAIPAVDKKVKEYREKSTLFRGIIIHQIQRLFDILMKETQENFPVGMSGLDQKISDNLYKIFGEKDPAEVVKKIQALQDEYLVSGSIFDYCGEMLRLMYDSESVESGFSNIVDKVQKTEPTILKAKKMDSTQKVADMMSKEVYPHIEDLLRDFNRDNEKIRNAFPNMPIATQEILEQRIRDELQYMTNGNGARVNTTRDGNSVSRTSGPTSDIIPKEWTEGNYGPIRESVAADIRSLVSRLTFLRREEMAQKTQGDQRRGKLNARKLYKSATGNRRVFKRLLPNSNTVQSFAFSVVVDTSGSMQGSRLVHTTRALTIFTEVFKKMDIPFEIITFDSGAKVLKEFSGTVDKSVEKKIGGLPTYSGGGTNLDKGLDKMKLEKQPEKNKVCIVLTDGGVGDMKWYDGNYFEPMKKRGVLSVGFGIECEQEMAKLCMGNSKVLENASTLPIEFSNLLKSLIKRKK